MKKLNLLFIILILAIFSGCTIEDFTARAVTEVENHDEELFNLALEKKDVSICRKIEFSLDREECIIRLAKEYKDSAICFFLEDEILRQECVKWIE